MYLFLDFQITKEDFAKFKYILGMDNYNIRCLQEIAPLQHSAKVSLLGQYEIDGEKQQIDDPYMADIEVFEEVYAKCLRCCQRFLDSQEQKPIPCTELQPYMYVEWVTMYEEAVAKLTTQVYTVICRHHLHEL